jgi:S-adenosylmethionine hydrolase
LFHGKGVRAAAAAKLAAEKVAAKEIVAELKQQLAEAEAQERALE